MRVVTDMTKIKYLGKKLNTICEREEDQTAEMYKVQQRTRSDSLANERDRKRRLRNLLSNKKEEDSLSQQD